MNKIDYFNKNRRNYVEQLQSQSPYIIFCYWEQIPCEHNKKSIIFYSSQESCLERNYLSLCKKTLYHTNSHDFLIVYLDQYTIRDYLSEEDLYPVTYNTMDDIFPSIPQKTDYFRLLLLQKYGGIWCDADLIFFKSMKPFVDLLQQYDYVGFGCYYQDCNVRENGYGYPANWVMISKQNGRLVTSCVAEIKKMLLMNKYIAKLNYHCFGKDLLKSCLEKMGSKYKYYHVPSKCIERDSRGIKWTNSRMMSEEDIDTTCEEKLFFIPIYNTAPGFPDQFLKLSETQILNENYLISKLFRKALNKIK